MINQPLTILYVEDDPNDVLLVQRAVKKTNAPARLYTAADGDKALAYLGAEDFADRDKFPSPQIVLLDLKMPRKSGFEVLAWIRGHPQLKRMIVIVFTSSRHDEDINRAYELGANSYLVKPVGFEALLQTMEEVNRYWGALNQYATL
jgi:CheY-like chemotaxis protein